MGVSRRTIDAFSEPVWRRSSMQTKKAKAWAVSSLALLFGVAYLAAFAVMAAYGARL